MFHHKTFASSIHQFILHNIYHKKAHWNITTFFPFFSHTNRFSCSLTNVVSLSTQKKAQNQYKSLDVSCTWASRPVTREKKRENCMRKQISCFNEPDKKKNTRNFPSLLSCFLSSPKHSSNFRLLILLVELKSNLIAWRRSSWWLFFSGMG